LIKCLADKELGVREKALEALRSITGEELACDVAAAQDALDASVTALMSWWQSKVAGEPVAAPAAAPEAPTGMDVLLQKAVEKVEATQEPTPEPVTAEPAPAEVFAFPEPDWSGIPAAAAPAEPVASAEPAAPAGKPSKEEILEMNKADLMALCDKLGIAFDPKMTKAEIRKLMLGE